MAAGYDLEARKRPVNLTLNENLVDQAKAQAARSRSVAEAVATWNAFNEKTGSIADEYCSL